MRQGEPDRPRRLAGLPAGRAQLSFLLYVVHVLVLFKVVFKHI